MKWIELICAKRIGDTTELSLADTRSRFDQDYDRIIFSHPFRKLQDKTQVFPMPEDDFVHTRLTHSLEVASVGRSLGKEVGKKVVENNIEIQKAGITFHDFGAITAAASLVHDIGNPPFGHSGEDSISSFFLNTDQGRSFEAKVSKEEWQDLINFEGNAQGFRILNSPMHKGLRLTYSILGSFTKYPLSSSSSKSKHRKSNKKYGFTNSEKGIFEKVATEMNLIRLGDNCWARHPLVFLVEAADDICYNIIDLEDATRMGLVPFGQTRDLFAAIIGKNYSSAKLEKIKDLNEKLGTLRAMAIHQLINETVACFMKNEKMILSGEFDTSLIELIPSKKTLDEIGWLSVSKIYQSRQVLEREAAGYEVISKLMQDFIFAGYHVISDSEVTARDKIIFRLIPTHIQDEMKKSDVTIYQMLLLIIDYIASLTDSSAIKLFRTISGYPNAN